LRATGCEVIRAEKLALGAPRQEFVVREPSARLLIVGRSAGLQFLWSCQQADRQQTAKSLCCPRPKLILAIGPSSVQRIAPTTGAGGRPTVKSTGPTMGARSSISEPCVKPTQIFVDGRQREFLFQKDIAPFLRSLGYAYSTSQIDKLCAPAVNKGPPVALWHGPRPLRTPEDVIAWAERRLRDRMIAIFNGK
jgi:hypothetical protein